MKPDANVCHLWQVPLTAEAVARLPLHLLREDENQRAARFHDPCDRGRYAGCRSALRAILGQYLDRDPVDLVLQQGEHGRPALVADPRLEFNVSHSGDLGLIAVAQTAPLGVDVEEIREMKNVLPLARRFLTPGECSAVDSAPETQRSVVFMRCWTRKEALLKSAGHGLTHDTRTVETGSDSAATVLEWPQGSGLQVCVRSIDLDPRFQDQFLAACATSVRVQSIEVRLFEGCRVKA